jgi:hypothetical protein
MKLQPGPWPPDNMKRKLLYGLSVILPALAALIFFAGNENDKIARQQEFNNRYAVFALDLPDTLSFAGEPVPLQDTEVKERLDRELLVNTYWQSQTILLLKRKSRWFETIEPVLKANGIPDDFKFLAMAESGFTHIVSPSGAAGYWQFLEGTGKQYGLEITSEVDERYHVIKATEAACRYFREAYNLFGSWTLAAAAYNMGMEGVREAMKTQQAYAYYDLLLPEETMRYLLRIVVLKNICKDPLKYGFHLRNRDYYLPYETVELNIDTTISNLAGFASGYGMSYKSLKVLNPWLRTNSLNNPANKNYRILVNKKYVNGTRDTLTPSRDYHQE